MGNGNTPGRGGRQRMAGDGIAGGCMAPLSHTGDFYTMDRTCFSLDFSNNHVFRKTNACANLRRAGSTRTPKWEWRCGGFVAAGLRACRRGRASLPPGRIVDFCATLQTPAPPLVRAFLSAGQGCHGSTAGRDACRYFGVRVQPFGPLALARQARQFPGCHPNCESALMTHQSNMKLARPQ